MKLLAFAASNSRNSINAAFVRHAAARFKAEIAPDAEIDLLDINDFEMPIYSVDREAEGGVPLPAHDFMKRIAGADALLISLAEHNGHYPAAYKNLFDWASRTGAKVYQNKPVAFLAASPGPGGAASVLKAAEVSAPFFGADVKGALSVANFHDVFDLQAGKVNDGALSDALGHVLANLGATTADAKAA
ncbi:NADPH-dependent FMN reductase [Aquicoccus sp. G2-2]|jgi:NAD(P)H-dependent FMN reductase|uniref:NADPH-dependent FMN reductase n=1 Tax=Aquicoccus sp. G2-2 TaxID=3092120 RepID=UPI002AE013B3|nr:NADPH-dependent FMN reductase [Aquicoccus sp. G2-2]MEA1113121.1 NADPH-dependent FMN reductase [Aquicoccus sp. G2-2]